MHAGRYALLVFDKLGFTMTTDCNTQRLMKVQLQENSNCWQCKKHITHVCIKDVIATGNVSNGSMSSVELIIYFLIPPLNDDVNQGYIPINNINTLSDYYYFLFPDATDALTAGIGFIKLRALQMGFLTSSWLLFWLEASAPHDSSLWCLSD